MDTPSARYLIPVVLILSLSAVGLSAVGGLVSTDKYRTLCAAGALFCLLMLLVPFMFLAMKKSSVWAEAGIAAALGALAGFCYGLCFGASFGFGRAVWCALMGAAIGYVSYWLRPSRRRIKDD